MTGAASIPACHSSPTASLPAASKDISLEFANSLNGGKLNLNENDLKDWLGC